MIFFALILLLGIFEFLLAIFHFIFPILGTKRFDITLVLKGIFGTCEFFFISPIPLLIVATFKKLFTKIYPRDFKVSDIEKKALISENTAKKTFISSLLGVTSTFILSQFIILLQDSKGNILMLFLVLIFQLILVYLYKVVSDHQDTE